MDYGESIQVISDAISSAVANSLPNVEMAALEARLAKLSKEIHDFQESQYASINKSQPPPQPHQLDVLGITGPEDPYADYIPDYLPQDLTDKVTQFLTNCLNSG